MIIRELQINNNFEESVQGFSAEFPYSIFYGELDHYVGGYVPWHWHAELEFFFVEKGTIEYHTQEQVYTMEAGEGGFINSNILHMAKPKNGIKNTLLKTHVLDKSILTGTYNSIYDIKYVSPILSCTELKSFKFYPEIENHKKILKLMRDAYDIADAADYLYEFKIRSIFSEIWSLFVLETKDRLSHSGLQQDLNNERIKIMLIFIQQNYMNMISLKDIAKEANISERECLRCFKHCLSMTPFEYLTNHRIRASANMLVNSNKSITTISSACGFSSNSYFCKVFKDMMHSTPKEYRKQFI